MRSVTADPLLPGRVVDALDGVAVVCWLLGRDDDAVPEVNAQQLETVLLKIVDTGVRGFVFERPGDGANAQVEHARDTWRIPVAEVEADVPARAWARMVADAVDSTLGIDRR